MKSALKVYSVLLTATFIFYLPIFSNSKLFLNRGNDLQEFFWPIIQYTKESIFTYKQIPLWYGNILSGTPLLPDPQSMIFYLPNLIFLFLPMGAAFVASMFLHVYIGGIGAYLAARHGFGFSARASLFAGLLYIVSPKTAGFIEAGHFGLVAAQAWLPFALLALIKIINAPRLFWSIVLAVSLSGLFYTHVLTFVIAVIASAVFILIGLFNKKSDRTQTLLIYLLGALITFGLIAVVFLPQLDWRHLTTRNLLLTKPDVYPKWTSKIEFLRVLFFPAFGGFDYITSVGSEKWITVGSLLPILSFLGFIRLKRLFKVSIFFAAVFLALIFLNNASPIYQFLLSQDWFVLTRVATRAWFLASLLAIYLGAFAVEKKMVGSVLIALVILESLVLSFVYFSKPVTPREYLDGQAVASLGNTNELFRVFCLDRCISQRDAVRHNVELIEGYSTLTQSNYYRQSWGLTGTYWDYYSLTTPPFGSYRFDELHPDYKALGDYNVKYIISPRKLFDPALTPLTLIDGYHFYKNNHFKSRVEGAVTYISPNRIVVDTREVKKDHLVLSEVYSDGWFALIDGSRRVALEETPNALRSVALPEGTLFVEFIYKPDGFVLGSKITLFTLGVIVLYFILVTKHKVRVPVKLFIVIFGIFIGLLLLEIFARVIFDRTTITWRDDGLVGRRLAANQTGTFVSNKGEYSTKLTINSVGFNDVEHTLVKPEGVYRILILGDSFVENFQVPLENTFFRQLEARLNNGQYGNIEKFEVIALGLGDTGTAQQLILLEELGLGYDPDLVIHMFFTGNDIKNNSEKLMGDKHRPYYSLLDGEIVLNPFAFRNGSATGKAKELVKNRTALGSLLFSLKGDIDARGSLDGVDEYPVDYHVYDTEYSKDYSDAWEVTKELIKRVHQVSTGAGAEYVLVPLANNEQINGGVWEKLVRDYPLLESVDLDRPDKVLDGYCEEEEINCRFMLPFFRKYLEKHPAESTHYAMDGHWNETGTNLAADFLASELAILLSDVHVQ